ncbi:PspC domain-containing protein [Candidatus Parcubacteria bacterium]|nr:PspC domain-containing protein [Candidatus Parcubacteria bacterium]
MEKTIHIHIGKTLFQLEESAYEKLSSYLSSLKVHFAAEADREEIIRDIESRIAEKLLEKKHRLVTTEDVTAVIAEIGDASAFEAGSSDSPEEPVRTAHGTKKLYRNTDDAIIAGVASGIAAYFNIEPIIIRSIFAVSIFFGGTGIAVYLLLWLLIPEAETASQKLEMRGSRVTLESIKRTVKDRLSETKERGTLKKILYFPAEIISALVRFLRFKAFPLLGKLFGALFAFGSFFAILGLTGFLSVIIANWNKPYIDPAIRAAIPESILSFSVGAGYVVLLIPLLFILLLGFRLVRGRSTIGSGVGFGLVGIWCLAVIASGAAATRIAGDYYEYTSNHPDYQNVTRTLEIAPFQSVSVENARVTFRHGDEQSVSLEGQMMDMERIVAETEDGVLSISTRTATSTCVLFCHHSLPTVVVTSPEIANVTLENGSASFDEFAAKDLALKIRSGNAYGTLATETLAVDMESSSLRLRLETESLTVKSANSHLDLEGSADTSILSFYRSNLSGERFSIAEAEVRAEDSFVQLGEMTTLRLKENDSQVIYRGEPEVTEM